MRSLFHQFFQKAPAPDSGTMPEYYRQALQCTYQILVVYYLLNHIIVSLVLGSPYLLPLGWIGVCLVMLFFLRRIPVRLNLQIYTVFTMVWCYIYIRHFGWGVGGQHFLIPLLIIIFFSVYESPWLKIAYWVLIIVFRMLLYAYTLTFSPEYALTGSSNMILQITNSVVLFIIVATICVIFSSNIQAAERDLLINNQELKREAGTDALTGLLNRRSMHDVMEAYVQNEPNSAFCVAIADIDFFKKVNDTYGHNCGDQLLKELAALFLRMMEGHGSVCRWGGEEFCFFLPQTNLDEAGRIITEICFEVERMVIRYDDHEIRFTITAGVEENDYQSPLQQIIESADNKLYIGKNNGRNQVVL